MKTPKPLPGSTKEVMANNYKRKSRFWKEISNTLLGVWVVLVLAALAAWVGKSEATAKTPEGTTPDVSLETKVDEYNAHYYHIVIERCYQGVTYVIFPQGNASVGSVKLGRNSQVVACVN